jgi:hypothetical protein
MLGKAIDKILRRAGYVKYSDHQKVINADVLGDSEFMKVYNECRPYTMTSLERLYSLYTSVQYILDNQIEGDLVECGVWKGGSSMMMALSLLQRGHSERSIYLYDTFEGMSEPTSEDKTFVGESAQSLLERDEKEDPDSIWCYSSLEEVKKNMDKTGYPSHRIHYIKGKVEDTLSGEKPGSIALLRVDTDWYASTKCELEQLYPLLSHKGILIIDDFGHWEGAKKAVVEYFAETMPFLHRIDNTGRLLIKY